jgi:putative ABC transport system substrate-binding protein
LGLVASYNRPGGNVTGLIDVLGAKRLGLLREIVPAATLIAVLLNPTWPTFDTQLKDVQEAARAVGQEIHVLHANTEREIDAAFDTVKEVRASAMMVGPSTSLPFGVTKLSVSRRATRCRRYTDSVNSWLPAA